MIQKSNDLVKEAILALKHGNLGKWLLELLKRTEPKNIDLIKLITKKGKELKGPELMPLKEFKRTFGPEQNMLYRESHSEFEKRVAQIYKALRAGFKPAPLLIEKSPQGLLVLDGNHTLEALRRNHKEYWAIYYSGDEISRLGQF